MSQKPTLNSRKLQIQSLSILSVLALFITIGYFFLREPNEPLSKTTVANVLPESIITQIQHAQYAELYDVTDTADNATTPYTLRYVLTGASLPDALIEDYIKELKKQYVNDAEASVQNNLTVQTTVIPYQQSFYSFVLHKRVLQQNVQVASEMKYFFYDAAEQKLVTFKQLLAHDEAHLQTIATLLRTTIAQAPQYASLQQVAFMAPNYVPRWSDFEQFTLSDEALTFTFATNSTPALLDVPLPIKAVNDLLAPAYQLPLPKMANVVDATYVLDETKKRVALTFDDGPHATVTPQVLDTLRKYDAKATFYVLGNKVQVHPELAQRIVSEGHEIGNHTWTHPNLVRLSDEEILNEYNRTTEAIIEATGYTPSTFRPPYGSTNDRVESLLPLPSVMWSIDTLDWKHRNANTTVYKASTMLHNNAIILMHDIHQPTADALDHVLANLQAAGFECVTVSELNMYVQ